MERRFHRWWAFAIVVIVWGFAAEEKILAAYPLNVDQLFQAATAAGFQVRDIKADIPSAVRSTLPFITVDYENNLLRTLRERFRLEKVVGPARDEWTAQLMLKEWVHKAIPGGNPKVTANHPGVRRPGRNFLLYLLCYHLRRVRTGTGLASPQDRR